MEIYSLNVISYENILGEDLLKQVEEKISKVKGDFRQNEIISLWRKTFSDKNKNKFLITKMKAKVSSGTYIRILVYEMGELLKSGAVTFGIKRTRVGDYTHQNSII